MDPIDVLRQIKDRPRMNLVEGYHDSTFRGVRHKQDGTLQHFTVTLSDGGPTLDPIARYSCTIEADDGFRVRGTPSDSVLGALYILQALERT